MSFKTAASRFGNGVLDVLDEMHKGQVRSEIAEIDKEQAALRAQLARLEETRTEKAKQLTR